MAAIHTGGILCVEGFLFLLIAISTISAKAQMTIAPVITTVAGNGTACAAPASTCGDGAAATSADLNNAQHVAVDSAGNLYIADNTDNRIRKVTATTGLISTVAGNGTQCSDPTATCGDGGAATSANLNYPNATAVDAAGNLYIADRKDHRIRKVSASSGYISTIAGNGTVCSSSTAACGDGGAATSANLNTPIDVAVDGAGNIYIADMNDSRIRMVSASTGNISTVAGNGTWCSSPSAACGDGGIATSANFGFVRAVALDSAGNLYISDYTDQRVRKVTASTGYISTVAGNGTVCASSTAACGDGSAATSANLDDPTNLAVDLAGNLYISDAADQRVRKVAAATGVITTVAGNGTICAASANTCGDGGVGASANLNGPTGLAIDTNGNLYIADDLDNRIRKLQANSTTVSLPATSISASSAAQDVSLSTTATETITSISAPASQGGNQEYSIGTITGCTVGSSNPVGTICVVPVTFKPAFPGKRSLPLQVATSTGNLNFSLTGTGTGPLAVLTPGVIASVAGTGTGCASPTANPACGDSGTAASATFNSPQSAFVDNLGNVWVADNLDHRIRKFSPGGTIATVAGNGTACSTSTNNCGDGGLATAAQLNGPTGVYVDGAGNLFIADYGDNRVREVAAGTQIITTVAGTGAACASSTSQCGDGGSALSAQLHGPVKLAMDSQGNLYIADMIDNRIRMLGASTGLLTTVAGTGTACSNPTNACGDGASALLANLNSPAGLFVDTSNNLYISDSGDNRVRKVQALNTGSGAGYITKFAGTGASCAGGANICGDGSAATSAQLNAPHALYVDSAGSIYIADTGDNRIRKVGAVSGFISTVAGNGTAGYLADGGSATGTELNGAKGLGLDSYGNLYIADTANNRIREVTLNQSILTYPTSTPVGASDGTDDPQTAMVSNIGNAALTFPPPSSGTYPSVATYFNLDASTTCAELTSSSSAATLASGADCNYAVDFVPGSAGTVNGSVVLTDNSLNVSGTQQTISLSATATSVGTTTTLATSGTPSTYGASVTITATVAPISGTALPLGTVQFSVNGSATGAPVTLNSSGQATFSSSSLAEGTDSITAVYTSTSSNFIGSAASAFNQVVNKGSTSSTISWATPAAIPYGTALSATQLNATSTLAGSFVYSPAAGTVLGLGSQTLNVTFTPTDTTDYSTGTASVTLTVTRATPTTTLALSASSLLHGQALTLTATVASGATAVQPGAVTFCDTSYSTCLYQAVVGKAQLTSSGTAAIKIIPAIGTHSYKAIFAGDTDYATSTSSNQSVTVTGTYPTATTISSSGSAGNYTLTGTVVATGGRSLSPTGVVAFEDTSNADYAVASAALGSSVVTQSFAAGSSNTVSVSRDVAVADFNGDGIPDMAIVDQSGQKVFVLLGNGDGTFTAASGSPVTVSGNTLVGIAAGDFNNDGNVDLAVTDWGSNKVYILLGNGNGTFQNQTSISISGGPEEIVAADFNNDGNLDLAIAEYSGNAVMVLLGNGAGGFTASGTFSTGSEPYSLAVADLNGDGNLDIVAGNSGASSVTVLLGDGTGHFSQPSGSPFAAGTNPSIDQSLVIGDFNGDGKPDLAVADQGNTTVAILLGNGDGTFGSPSFLTALGGQKAMAMADFNGDGNLDLAVCDTGTGTIKTYMGNGNGTFQSAVSTASGSTACSFLLAADFNGDGNPDLVVPLQGNNKAVVLLDSMVRTATASATSVSIPGTGSHNIEAVYGGDTNNAISTSSTIALSAAKAATTLSLQASPTTSAYGQQVILTATLSPYAVGGLTTNGETITFKSGSTTIGTGTLSGGIATLSLASLSTGSDSLTAVYAGNTNFLTSTSSALPFNVSKATPVIPWATPAAVTYGTALSATQLNATSGGVAGSFAYSPVSGTVLTAGSQTLLVTFTPTDTTDYNSATGSVSLTVNKATPTITWATPSAITYGTALSTTQLNATSGGLAGTMVYTPDAGTVLTAGSQTLSVAFTPTDLADYNTASASVNLVVNKVTPTITWGTPAAITYGTALSASQLNATSGGVAGTMVYTPATGTVPAAGSQTLSVAFTPTDTTDYNSASGSVTLTVNKATPTITWATPAAITYGTPLSAIQLDATSGGVAGSFVYTPVSGTVLTAGSQTLSVTFTPTDTTDYNTATGSVSLTVNKATPTITWTTPSAITFGTALSATQLNASSGGVAGTLVYTPDAGTVLGAGSQTLSVVFTPTDTTDYNTASDSVTLAVNKATPTLTVATSGTPSIYGASVTFTATISSGPTGSITFYDGGVSIGTGTISGNTASLTPAIRLAAGAHTITAGWASNSNYNSVVSSGITQVVSKFTPTLSWETPSPISYGTALSAAQLDASSGGVPGTFVYSPASGAVLGVGSQTLSVTFNPTDSADYNTASGTVTLTVNDKVTPVITWATPAAITYGSALSATQLNASSGGVAGTMLYSPAAGTVLGGGAQILQVTFTPTDTTDYNTVIQTVTLTVNKTSVVVSGASSAAPSLFGDSVQISFTFTGAGVTPTGTATILDGAVTLATVPISAGAATYSTNSLTSGPHTMKAIYNGDDNYQ